LEALESRVVLSGRTSLVPPDFAIVPIAAATPAMAGDNGLVPVPLANGGIAWMEAPSAVGVRVPVSSGSSGRISTQPAQPPRPIPGAILGHLPVGSPFGSAASEQVPGLAGFVPLQIQTAYGLSTGSSYNNNIVFGAIKGNGAGQTIGIYEEGYNPAFVDTSDPNYGSSALAFFDNTFGLPDPPSLTFVDHTGTPLSSSNNSSNNPDFFDYGDGVEIALDIEWAHAMAPAANIIVLSAVPQTTSEDVPLGIATLAGLPGVTVISASYGQFMDALGQVALEQSFDSTIIQPALAANPNVSVFASSGDQGAMFGLAYPAASPEVVSVGGTSLFVTPSGQWSSEIGWFGSGGGFSLAFALPSYQQSDGFSGNSLNLSTNPDVSADADPSTGVAVYDPFDFGATFPWVEVGGTSLSSPLWAGMAAIADQGRVLAGGHPLGATAMLTDLYDLANVAPGDFHDITQGNNGFAAGAGYDLVTGLGTPKANLLIPDLSAFGLASGAGITTQPPPSVAAGAGFGIVASATDSFGTVDLSYNGTATLTLESGPSGAVFNPVTAPVIDGQAVFSNLSLSRKGSGYTFEVAMTGLAATTTSPVAVFAPHPGTGYFYPLPLSNSLGTDVAAADSDSFSSIVITLSVSSIPYTVTGGQLVIDNGSSLPGKAFSIVGQGESSSVINAESTSRVFEIVGTSSLSVVIDGLTIVGGRAVDGGILGGSAALGGGLLVDGGNVALSNVAVLNNAASGAAGADGAVGRSATTAHPTGGPGGSGGAGGNSRGGGIYLATGNLTLTNDVIQGNVARGGAGGAGGRGGNGFTIFHTTNFGFSFIGPFHSGNAGPGGNGGAGGSGAGGGLYLGGGTLAPLNSIVLGTNAALGGAGGGGGRGGQAGLFGDFVAGNGGAGAPGGNGGGGAVFMASGTVKLDRSVIEANTAAGGPGGGGGSGGTGALGAPGVLASQGQPGTTGGIGRAGGNAGNGAAGGSGRGGGIYIPGSGTVVLNQDSTIAANNAIGAAGGAGGRPGPGGAGGNGGTGGRGATGAVGGGAGGAGGRGGRGGNAGSEGQAGNGGPGGSGAGGGLYLGSGLVSVSGAGGALGIIGPAAPGAAGGVGGVGAGGGLFIAGGSVVGNKILASANRATGGAGGQGGLGGRGGFETLGGGGGAGGAGGAGGTGGPGGHAGVGGTGGNGGSAGLNNPGGNGVTGGVGGPGGAGQGAGIFVDGGVVVFNSATVSENVALGGAGGLGGKGGSGGTGGGPFVAGDDAGGNGGAGGRGGLDPADGHGATGGRAGNDGNGAAGGNGGNAGNGAAGGLGGSGDGGGLYVAGGTITFNKGSVHDNQAAGGAGGTGGAGGLGGLGANGGGGGGEFVSASAGSATTTFFGFPARLVGVNNGGNGGIAAPGGPGGNGGTGGPGGNGGNGGNGANGATGGSAAGGGLYVSGGSVTIFGTTFANNTATGGVGGVVGAAGAGGGIAATRGGGGVKARGPARGGPAGSGGFSNSNGSGVHGTHRAAAGAAGAAGTSGHRGASGAAGTLPGAAGSSSKDTDPGGIYIGGGKVTFH
jgi:hypothetical protein